MLTTMLLRLAQLSLVNPATHIAVYVLDAAGQLKSAAQNIQYGYADSSDPDLAFRILNYLTSMLQNKDFPVSQKTSIILIVDDLEAWKRLLGTDFISQVEQLFKDGPASQLYPIISSSVASMSTRLLRATSTLTIFPTAASPSEFQQLGIRVQQKLGVIPAGRVLWIDNNSRDFESVRQDPIVAQLFLEKQRTPRHLAARAPDTGANAANSPAYFADTDTSLRWENLYPPQSPNTSSRNFLAIGNNVTGEPVGADFSLIEHLIIVGKEGTGKSSTIRTLKLSAAYNGWQVVEYPYLDELAISSPTILFIDDFHRLNTHALDTLVSCIRARPEVHLVVAHPGYLGLKARATISLWKSSAGTLLLAPQRQTVWENTGMRVDRTPPQSPGVGLLHQGGELLRLQIAYTEPGLGGVVSLRT